MSEKSTKLGGAGEPHRILGIDWAPLSIPLERRLQTLMVLHYVTLFIIVPVFSVLVPIYLLLWTRWWWTMVLYAVWFWYDYDRPKRGPCPNQFFRSKKIWGPLADYFPVKLHKTADLDPSRNYILGYHPHGVLGVGDFANFATEATGFSEKFPGIRSHPCTLVGQFWFPFRREYILQIGAIEVSKESIRYCLSKLGKGNAVVIVIGGAIEALEAHSDQYRLHLQNRKGFVKMAIQTGADLVPVFTFGENQLYDQVRNPPGSLLRKVQVAFKRYAGFTPPVFHGRGVFNYTFGILPYRTPIDTVVGKPIRTEQPLADPSPEFIEDLHKRYCEGLVQLFEDHKAKYGVPEDTHLEIC